MKELIPILSITGSDSFGETGIQADIKTISELGGYALSAITSIAIKGEDDTFIHNLPQEVIINQVRSIIESIHPQAIKIGLIRDAQCIKPLREEIIACRRIICDPGIISSQGELLTSQNTVEAIKKHLIPISTLLILKCKEAEMMLHQKINTDDDMIQVAQQFVEMGAQAVMLRGSHHTEGRITSLLYANGRSRFFSSHNTEGWQKHGVSAAISSAIATRMAMGEDVPTAIRNAHNYIHSQVVYAVSSKSQESYRAADLYNQFMSLITEHYAAHHDVTYYAERLAITTRYLSQVCNETIGRSPKQIIDNYILHESIELLENSRLPIQSISDKLGFSSQAMFCKFFRHHEGRSPSDYRRIGR